MSEPPRLGQISSTWQLASGNLESVVYFPGAERTKEDIREEDDGGGVGKVLLLQGDSADSCFLTVAFAEKVALYSLCLHSSARTVELYRCSSGDSDPRYISTCRGQLDGSLEDEEELSSPLYKVQFDFLSGEQGRPSIIQSIQLKLLSLKPRDRVSVKRLTVAGREVGRLLEKKKIEEGAAREEVRSYPSQTSQLQSMMGQLLLLKQRQGMMTNEMLPCALRSTTTPSTIAAPFPTTLIEDEQRQSTKDPLEERILASVQQQLENMERRLEKKLSLLCQGLSDRVSVLEEELKSLRANPHSPNAPTAG